MTTRLSGSALPHFGSTTFHYKRISWAAIFAGTLVALGVQLLLSLLGIGIGMGGIDPLHRANPGAGVAAGTYFWWAMTFSVSLFIGGWVSGKLSRTINRFESIMHGILTWIIFVLINFFLLTSIAGSMTNAATGILGGAVSFSRACIYAFTALLLGAIFAGIAANIGRGDDFRGEYEPASIPGGGYIASR